MPLSCKRACLWRAAISNAMTHPPQPFFPLTSIRPKWAPEPLPLMWFCFIWQWHQYLSVRPVSIMLCLEWMAMPVKETESWEWFFIRVNGVIWYPSKTWGDDLAESCEAKRLPLFLGMFLKLLCLSHVLCAYILISGNIIHAQIFISVNGWPDASYLCWKRTLLPTQ